MADKQLWQVTPVANDVKNDDGVIIGGQTAGTRYAPLTLIANFVHNLWAAFINAITPLKTSFASGDKIPVVNGSSATAMEASKLLELTAQNALVGNVAPAFDPTRTSENPYKAGETVVYNGKRYIFKVNHYGAWNASDVYDFLTFNKIFNLSKSSDLLEAVSYGGNQKLFDGYNVSNDNETNFSNAPFAITDIPTPCGVSSIKGKFTTSGILSVGVCNIIPNYGTAYSENDVDYLFSVNVVSAGEQTIKFPFAVFIPNGCCIVIGKNTDTAKFSFGSLGKQTGFKYKSISVWSVSTNSLGFDFFGADIRSFNVVNKNVYNNELKVIDGYNAANTQYTSNLTTLPYVLNKTFNKPAYITKIRVNVETVGVLSYGIIKSSDVTANKRASAVFRGSFNVENTGVQILTLPNPMFVGTDELIVLSMVGDTCKLYYGSSGVDKTFYFWHQTNYFSLSSNSLGVDVYAFTFGEKSAYCGKKLSILGDSISTFSGYIPEGNVTWYPQGNVKSPSDTWWYKLISALGLVLDVNNSWSGSRVTTTDGETSAGCMTRCENLGTSPDVIIVWMGINDFSAEVPLGTYDGKSTLPSTTTTFREAYAIMLNKILTKYKSSEVWVCTLPQCERDNPSDSFPEINSAGVALASYNEAIKELAEAFGVKVLDNNKSGLTWQNRSEYTTDSRVHPNKAGHSLVANNAIRQLDNYIRTRF